MAVKVPTLIRVNGLLVPDFINVDRLKDFELYPDDVWVVTYPKCGTTWTQQIVRLIRNKGVQDGVRITAAVPFLEANSFYQLDIDKIVRPRAFKSHFPYDLFPCGPPHTTPCKYIYVARNPKDVAVSLYFHTRALTFPDMDWETFWKKYISGDLDYGNYFDHLLSWLPHKDDKNVLFLKYEDMKRNLLRAVSQIAAFIGVDLSSDVIAKIAELASFEKMQHDSTTNYAWSKLRSENAPGFLRRGVIGDWKNFLSVEQSAEMNAICAERLKDTGLQFQYE